jgi:hypothetical protein
MRHWLMGLCWCRPTYEIILTNAGTGRLIIHRRIRPA